MNHPVLSSTLEARLLNQLVSHFYEPQNPLTKIQQLEAELSYLEDAQRDETDPFKAQQARFRLVEALNELYRAKSA